MTIKPAKITELVFESRDVEVFKIPDPKTRIATVQNYFFPRLEFLLRYTLDIVQSVYGVNPYERMIFVYRPSNRKDAKVTLDFDEAHIGISGKRRTDRPLAIKHKDGEPYFFHPTYLTYNIRAEGDIRVELRPFCYLVDKVFVESVANLVKKNLRTLSPIWALSHISYSSADRFVTLEDSFTSTNEQDAFDIVLFSPGYYFPVDTHRGLEQLIFAFVSLYPLVDSFMLIGEGQPTRLPMLLGKFQEWWQSLASSADEDRKVIDDALVTPQIPELDSYTFVRPGLWWSVLARDNWTCRSCGRTPKDGVALEVDHILPRSKGGTDDIGNLQTFCKKCNIGKGNRDSTDLR